MNEFELYKSNICQLIKNKKPSDVVDNIIQKKIIVHYFNKKDYMKAFYLLGLVDYYIRKYNLHSDKSLDKYREYKLNQMIYPASCELVFTISKDDSLKRKALSNAIPEFLKYNIVEGEIDNVY